MRVTHQISCLKPCSGHDTHRRDDIMRIATIDQLVFGYLGFLSPQTAPLRHNPAGRVTRGPKVRGPPEPATYWYCRTLLEVGRGLRTLARLLASDLHSPGVDQSRRQHRVPMRFLYYVMNSSNQHNHSNVLQLRILTWSRSEQTSTPCANAISVLALCS